MVGKEHLPLKGWTVAGVRDEGCFMTEEAIKKVGYTEVFARNRASKARTIVNVGGSGSSKSHSLAQLMIEKFITEQNKQFVITRKTMPALRRSAYALIVELMTQYGLYEHVDHNKTDNVLVLPQNNNSMWFMGLDEPSKAKSIAGGVSYFWLEEADEFDFEDYLAFKLQLRRPTQGEPNQCFLSFNPIDGNGWIPTKLLLQDDVEVLHSTVLDNPFADADYVASLKKMADEDENYYRVYFLGEWGRLENLILTNYKQVDVLPEKWDAWCFGLDFGYTHPTVLMKVVLADNKLYWHEALCQTKLTNSDLIERLSHFERGDIYADWSEPQRMQEIRNAGYTVLQANKDVKLGLDLCRRQTIHITKSSITTLKQIRGYRRKKDANGIILDDPVKIEDDTIDAGRYGTMGITQRFGYATQKPRPTEPIKSLSFSGQNKSKILERWLKHGT